jgi:hypothetical protein
VRHIGVLMRGRPLCRQRCGGSDGGNDIDLELDEFAQSMKNTNKIKHWNDSICYK